MGSSPHRGSRPDGLGQPAAGPWDEQAPSVQYANWTPERAWATAPPGGNPRWARPAPPAGEMPWVRDPLWPPPPPWAGAPPQGAGPRPGEGTNLLPPVPPGPAVPRKRHKTRWAVMAAAVAVALAAAIGIIAARHSGGAPSAAAGTQSAGSGPVTNLGTRASSRGLTGPRTVTEALVFPHRQEVVNGLRFTLVASVTDDDCPVAANGAFAAALAAEGCKQVIRGTFVDSGRRYAVTTGVAVLPSRAAARSADDVKQFGPDVWFTGLDGPPGSGASIVSKTVGVGYDLLYRRYIVYALATYSDGRNPTGQAAEVAMLTSLSQSFTTLVAKPIMARG